MGIVAGAGKPKAVTVIAWIVEATWPACVDAAGRHTPSDGRCVRGSLGRGHTEWDSGPRVEELESVAAAQLLDQVTARLGRQCRKVETTGNSETDVIAQDFTRQTVR
jgi:hypothetical protein